MLPFLILLLLPSSFGQQNDELICGGENRELQCPPGLVMDILTADYGRDNGAECNNGMYPVGSPEMSPAVPPCVKNATKEVQDL